MPESIEMSQTEIEAANYEMATDCLAMVYECALSWGKVLVGPEYNLDSTPAMMLNDAIHNLFVIATRMTPDEFKDKLAKAQ